ncbi:hypothetical protein C0991_006255 [Blastosporella zonata]|nr:hypothetical protein C0991_006255 [Blastosporella zonata]
MQQPTLINTRIRSTADAHRIFHAVQKGHLEKIKRRLDAEERGALGSGCIYVWEERGSHTVDVTGLGIERFTEGKRPNDAPNDWDQLIKQTYSAWVNKREGKRKWHLTAYFTENTVNDLQTIDDIPTISHLFPSPGLYQSARVASRRPQASKKRSDPSKRTAIDRTFAPFSNQASSEPVTMHNPYNPPADQFSTQSSSYSSRGLPTIPLPAPGGQHSYTTSSTPSVTYVNAYDGSKPQMSTRPAMGAIYTNPAWRRGPMPYPPTNRGRSTPPTTSLPPVNAMYDEEQLFPAGRSPGSLSPTQIVYRSPYSLEAAEYLGEPSYELASAQDGSDSDGSRDFGLALAPMHDLERRRYVYRRDSLDDRALRSFL